VTDPAEALAAGQVALDQIVREVQSAAARSPCAGASW
jgi:hypothetical protein